MKNIFVPLWMTIALCFTIIELVENGSITLFYEQGFDFIC
ncbi:hypothetical protein STFR1_20462 [Bacillus vallismortis]